MEKVVIEGIAGYDGEYEFDASYFTNRELHTIKRLSGVRAGEIADAFQAGDNDLVLSFAVIALQRNGKPIHENVLWDAPVGKITFAGEPDEEQGDDLPPGNAPDSDERIAA